MTSDTSGRYRSEQKRIVNPVTEELERIDQLPEGGYKRHFLEALATLQRPDMVDLGASPVLTFDDERWEYREMDGQHVLVKREPETKFDELVIGNGREIHTGSSQGGRS